MKTLEEMGLSRRVAVVDIETAAKGPDARIGSIGCVVVDVPRGEIVGEFYTRADHLNQTDRTTDEDTLRFWGKQKAASPIAWEEMFNQALGRPPLLHALNELSDFLGHQFGGDRVQLMGNGPEFDNVILAHAYAQVGIPAPWDYGANQSLRTVAWFGRMFLGMDPKYSLAFEGAKHQALDDARHEARYLIEITRAFWQLAAPQADDFAEAQDAFPFGYPARDAD